MNKKKKPTKQYLIKQVVDGFPYIYVKTSNARLKNRIVARLIKEGVETKVTLKYGTLETDIEV
jgi:hypothetical protein